MAGETFRVGDRVRHSTFGTGMVVQISSDSGLVSVAFEGLGVKKLQPGIAPLTRTG